MNTQEIDLSADQIVDDPRWLAVLARDRKADGTFVYGVKTTGVFCRPSCSARRALRENVQFFATVQDAQREGLRACKRCRPDGRSLDEQHASLAIEACRLIETSTDLPNLETLARNAGLSTFHFQRVFKSSTGLTPKEYADAHRTRRVRRSLSTASSVTDAIYDAGFNSNGNFYAHANSMLGMTPSAFRQGGAEVAVEYGVAPCSLGFILVARTERGICAISMGDKPDALIEAVQSKFRQATVVSGGAGFEELLSEVVGLVDTAANGRELPLDIRGTAFQTRVWEALRKIPAGVTKTYTEIAEEIGMPRSVRAVAQACGANPLAVAIPCHRVVRKSGDVSGYRWGIERKRTLLEREALSRTDAQAKGSEA
jgi:AraC family transcriptional regulator of adaptative response/methylated-DNA-[protein]-cysteine methyltransferase